MTEEDLYLLKLKGAGLTDLQIAKRLNITQDEIVQRISRIFAESQAKMVNGYLDACNQFRTLCQQYEMVGESLKVIGGWMNSTLTVEELRALIKDTPEETVASILSSCIVLSSFRPPTPEEAVQNASQN